MVKCGGGESPVTSRSPSITSRSAESIALASRLGVRKTETRTSGKRPRGKTLKKPRVLSTLYYYSPTAAYFHLDRSDIQT